MITLIKQILQLSNEWKNLITNREASSYLKISFNLNAADLHEILDLLVNNLTDIQKEDQNESDD